MLGLSAAMADFVVEGKKFKEELPKSNWPQAGKN
jgi:hypothetical protein